MFRLNRSTMDLAVRADQKELSVRDGPSSELPNCPLSHAKMGEVLPKLTNQRLHAEP